MKEIEEIKELNNIEKIFTQEEYIQMALGHLLQTAAYFEKAEMIETGSKILKFSKEAYDMLKQDSNNNLDINKLEDAEYDSILADIFNA